MNGERTNDGSHKTNAGRPGVFPHCSLCSQFFSPTSHSVSHLSFSLFSLFSGLLSRRHDGEVTERSRDRERYLALCAVHCSAMALVTLPTLSKSLTYFLPNPHYPQPVMPASAGTLGVAADTATRPARSAPRLVEGLLRCPSWPRAPGERTEGERKGGERAGERAGV